MKELYDAAIRGMIYNTVVSECKDEEDAAVKLVNGFCVVLFPEVGALAFEVRTPDKRGTSAPEVENTVKGAKDAFVETIRQAEGFDIDWSTAYKRMPQGWSAEDPHSEYYRLRNFLLVKLIDRDFVLSDDFISRAADQMSRTRPFNDTLNRAIEYAREMGW